MPQAYVNDRPIAPLQTLDPSGLSDTVGMGELGDVQNFEESVEAIKREEDVHCHSICIYKK